ncbi:MAG: DUF5680 domain-containing protein [Candidatus Pacebacteria bacterium]|nr:DUF5680 domain-containing protein [Candidatus Paceibacterota bacterium]
MLNLKRLKEFAKTDEFRAEAQDVFFDGMQAGYASSSKKGTIVELPGFKLIPAYVCGPWKVIDGYHVTPLSPASGGTTIISYEISIAAAKKDVPVWMMQYFGWYYEEVIPCLKAALRESYGKKEFRGGRGPDFWESKSPVFHYTNKSDVFENTFGCFRGEESIETPGGATMGVHRYQGGLML